MDKILLWPILVSAIYGLIHALIYVRRLEQKLKLGSPIDGHLQKNTLTATAPTRPTEPRTMRCMALQRPRRFSTRAAAAWEVVPWPV